MDRSGHVDSNGIQANGGSGGAVISSDGRYVAFVSTASNLVPGDSNGVRDVFVRDVVGRHSRRPQPLPPGAGAPEPAKAT